jgi:hypothetical protein
VTDLPLPQPVDVVLADANVLYSRVLRDYLLHAAEIGVCAVTWSTRILDEATRGLQANIPGFTADVVARLVAALTDTFPDSLIDPSPADYARLARWRLPDEDDRHVIAAALAAESTIICTGNIKHFPEHVTEALDLAVMTPDQLLTELFDSHPAAMLEVHRMTVAAFTGATDVSTVTALRKAQATRTADKVESLLGLARRD